MEQLIKKYRTGQNILKHINKYVSLSNTNKEYNYFYFDIKNNIIYLGGDLNE